MLCFHRRYASILYVYIRKHFKRKEIQKKCTTDKVCDENK